MTLIRDAYRRVRLFYDPAREPLRRSVYTSLIVIVPALVTAGILSGAGAASLLGLLPVLLAVPVEHARQKVTPLAAPVLDDEPGKHAVDRVR